MYTPGSHRWLDNIGRLTVPGSRLENGRKRHHIEDCSATLVARPGHLSQQYLLTAWHCLEFYTDLSRTIRFTLPFQRGGAVTGRAVPVASGGRIEADWALLRLDLPVKESRTLPAGLPLARSGTGSLSESITMAGYSRDAGLGRGGIALTFDAHCTVQEVTTDSHQTDCVAFKGASGGPVLQRDTNNNMVILGVVSQGNGAGLSTYTPVEQFAGTVQPLLRR